MMSEMTDTIVTVVSADGHPVSSNDLESLQITIAPPDDLTGSGEPAIKRTRFEDDLSTDQAQSVKQILFNINKAICLRLDAIENKLETVSVRTKYLEEKVEQLVTHTKLQLGSPQGMASQVKMQNSNANFGSKLLPNPFSPATPNILRTNRNGAVVVGIPSEKLTLQDGSPDCLTSALVGGVMCSGDSPNSMDPIQNLGPNVTLITLNTEEDFPHGTWLGDETNPEMRVRVPITPSDLLHIHSNCRTAEKMALTMLDYLFDRETQATSNLSGMGKHGKKQLDPLMIYGIRCHLIHRFGITEQDWHRIKQNIDSKCRTAFRRRVKGLPLTVKAFRGKAPSTYVHVTGDGIIHGIDSDSENSLQHEDSELHIQEDLEFGHSLAGTEILTTSGGQIQVLHATPEQVAQLQQTHQIQILQGDQIMQLQQDGQEAIHVSVSMPQQSEGLHVMNTENGELQIAQSVSGEETLHIHQMVSKEEPETDTDQ